MSLTAQGTFDANQAEELYDVLPDDTYLKIAKKHHLELHNEPIYEDISYQESAAPRLGFWGTLFAAIAGINAVSGTANDTSITDIVTGTAPTALPTMGIAMDDGTMATVINTAASLEVTKAMAAWIDEVH